MKNDLERGERERGRICFISLATKGAFRPRRREIEYGFFFRGKQMTFRSVQAFLLWHCLERRKGGEGNEEVHSIVATKVPDSSERDLYG